MQVSLLEFLPVLYSKTDFTANHLAPEHRFCPPSCFLRVSQALEE